ncbi:hypothetical protein HU200_029866 [Digitaria exilis]|uniref:Uncharacterized protein n=1 Tax=Digitaria exilis TaxID=1010633 RepID=A0A835BRX7_9POAL|nr:hypothetical protein HU200_029866 [Digitaria exilis]
MQFCQILLAFLWDSFLKHKICQTGFQKHQETAAGSILLGDHCVDAMEDLESQERLDFPRRRTNSSKL